MEVLFLGGIGGVSTRFLYFVHTYDDAEEEDYKR